MIFFIPDAIAANNVTTQSSSYSLLVMLIILGLIFYFMILRPQQKRTKTHKELINSLSKGDEVLTTGGLVGYVIKISSADYVTIALNDTNEIVIKRDFITAILPKGTIKAL